MSHIVTVDVVVKDLDAMAEAAEACGMELVRGATTYKWFGRFVGDYNDPALKALGIPVSDYGKCEHKLRVKGAGSETYEIGLARNPKGEGWVMLFDFWNGGSGLMEKISATGKSSGKDAGKLLQEYTTATSVRELQKQGFRVTRSQENGKVKLKATRAAGKVQARR